MINVIVGGVLYGLIFVAIVATRGDLPDLSPQLHVNWRNPAVQDAMFDDMRFWLERGVDGFRLDVANFIMKDPQLRDNPPNPDGVLIHKERGDYDSQLHVHDRAHPDVHIILRKIRALLDDYSSQTPHIAIGERSKTALNSGSYRGLESASENCFVYLRQCDNERLVVAINFSEEPQQVSMAEFGEGHILLSTSLCRKEHIKLAELRLQGHEGCIIELPDGT